MIFAAAPSGGADVELAHHGIKPSDIPTLIMKYTKISKRSYSETADKRWGKREVARAHLELAFLYSCHQNKSPDYERALGELNIYLETNPGAARDHIIGDRLSLLKKMVALRKSNSEMKETLEKLKALDLEMERQRKRIL